MSQADLITDKTNIRYLSGFTGSSGFMLITQKKSYLFTDFRYIERAQNSINKDIEIVNTSKVWRNPQELRKNWQKILHKHHLKIIGIEEDNLTLEKFKKYQKISKSEIKIKFTDVSGKIAKIRENKTAEEIKFLQKSQSINEQTFKSIKKIIQDFVFGRIKNAPTEIELAWKIREIGHHLGCEDVSFDPIVAFGKHSAIPHHEPEKSGLKKGDIVLIDMGMKYRGYCSDMTRTFFTGIPTKKQQEIYDLVLRSQVNAIKKIKAGITGAQADKLSRKIIGDTGYGEYYGHAGGHGIGLDIHESPALSQNYLKKIQENTVITIEPGIYLTGEFGVRIEDMGLVTSKGFQNFTKIPK